MRTRLQPATVVGLTLTLALLGACAQEQEEVMPEPSPAPTVAMQQSAMANLQFAEGQTGSGTVTFTSTGQGVRIEAEVSGVMPGMHGFHLHEFGECAQPTFESAGAHYNPAGATHAGPDTPERHAGDFGNMMVGEDGSGRLSLSSDMLSIDEVLGKAVVLHEGEDDLVTDPTGESGGRIACGVVERTDGGTMGLPASDRMQMGDDENVMTTPTGGTRVSPTPSS